ncbi:MAG: toprim domain-containing protein [Eubacterium sp.]|nr:toprim domain-containing protein [Eubacterium sp.]
MKVWIPEEEVQRARDVPLVDFFRSNRPGMYANLRKVGGQYIMLARQFGTSGYYSSFRINATTGHWWRHSKGLHGCNAIDYLVKMEGYGFQQAVLEILGTCEEDYKNQNVPRRERRETKAPSPLVEASTSEPKILLIPEKDKDTSVIRKYLEGRGIYPEVVEHFIREGSIYQDAKYKSVCFVGCDRDGTPRLINQRSTYGSFKGNTRGSDRRYSFMQHMESETSVHLFEAPIDLLSYACLLRDAGYDFRSVNLVSLSGISGAAVREGEEIRLPAAMEEYLERFSDTETVYIHFDNDEPGRNAGLRLQAALNDRGLRVLLQYPPEGCKDVNDYLVGKHGREAADTNKDVTEKGKQERDQEPDVSL